MQNDPNVGNTTTSIHAFLKDMYDNPIDGVPPTYLLIVGDVAQVPSFSTALSYNHITDMYYCEFDGGGDFLPEMYFGRLSATNAGDIEAQVNKTLTHEKYTFGDPSFPRILRIHQILQESTRIHASCNSSYLGGSTGCAGCRCSKDP